MTKILIIGAGAVGSFYGARLASVGVEMTIWCRSDYDFVKKNGIKIESYLGDYHFSPHKVIKNLDEVDDEFDYILIATKALPSIDICGLIKNILRPKTKIILVQNGIHIEKNIAQSFPNNELISAIAFVASSRKSLGVVHHQAYGKITIGTYNGKTSEALEFLANLWQKSGIEVEISDKILFERWKKLVWNGAFNPLSVILHGKNTLEILNNDLAMNLVKNIMKEICELAKADNCELPADVIEKNIIATQQMKPYKTSMLLDFEAGRQMEVEAILGNAVKFAQSKSILIPYLSTIYAILANY
jgi:2-dehydropantoate 2-reductase